uniref:(northern house mosquito) hypothetical protein n=1 Tax=Culex pipiens TaxID=7175 RepID=A0A8D8ACF8_CULPI
MFCFQSREFKRSFILFQNFVVNLIPTNGVNRNASSQTSGRNQSNRDILRSAGKPVPGRWAAKQSAPQSARMFRRCPASQKLPQAVPYRFGPTIRGGHQEDAPE